MRIGKGSIRTVYRRKKNLVYCHEGLAPQIDLPPPFSMIALDDVRVNEFFSAPRDRERRSSYLRFLDESQIGILIHLGSTWASVGWVSTPTSSPPPHVPANLARDAYWMHNQHTAERFRRKGLHVASIAYGLKCIASKANQSSPIITDVAQDNLVSRKSQEHAGFLPAGVITLTTIGIPGVWRWTHGKWDRDAPHPSLVGGHSGR